MTRCGHRPRPKCSNEFRLILFLERNKLKRGKEQKHLWLIQSFQPSVRIWNINMWQYYDWKSSANSSRLVFKVPWNHWVQRQIMFSQNFLYWRSLEDATILNFSDHQGISILPLNPQPRTESPGRLPAQLCRQATSVLGWERKKVSSFWSMVKTGSGNKGHLRDQLWKKTEKASGWKENVQWVQVGRKESRCRQMQQWITGWLTSHSTKHYLQYKCYQCT